MTERERFRAVFSGEKPDRLPVYFFGSWEETKKRWKSEGLVTDCKTANEGPQIPGMDCDWETGMWDCHGLVNPAAIGDSQPKVIEETEDYLVIQNELGGVIQHLKQSDGMSHAIKHSLEPTRESWEHFKKFLNPNDPRRRPENWKKKAEELNQSERVLAFMGGSLYGWLREWMGVENISLIMYDDPELFDEMVEYISEYFMALYEPILSKVKFDLAYFFEDCCGSTGPLFSPEMHKRFFDTRYRKMVKFYKEHGVALTMLDSDGKIDALIPGWLESGFDIIFPIEIGSWNASPVDLRKQFGNKLKMLGGVNKHVITLGEEAIREHLTALRPIVLEGGYLPIPDHRIPPDCSYNDFLTYIKVFKEVFAF